MSDEPTLIEILAGILRHALDDRPDECCGFVLAGAEVRRCRNVAASPRSCEVDPADQYAAFTSGHVLATYHSHPSALVATPSAHDGAMFRQFPDFLHLIVALGAAEPAFGAWRVESGGLLVGRVVEVPIPEGWSASAAARATMET